MKKLISTFMIVTLLICCFTATAFAEDQTVLTTTVPDATYTLNIPDNQEIEFGVEQKNIGQITVTDAKGFAEGKNLKIFITYDAFKSEDVETTIPYDVRLRYESSSGNWTIKSGDSIYFKGTNDGGIGKLVSNDSIKSYLNGEVIISTPSLNWGKALGGEYSSTITFTSEVVSSNQ